ASTNYGEDWELTDAPATNWYAVAMPQSGSKFFGAVHGGGIYSAVWQPAFLQEETATEDIPKPLVLTPGALDSANYTYAILTGPTNGGLGSLNSTNGTVTYTPFANFNGEDSFTFRAFDGYLYTTGTVSLTIEAVNDAPVAYNQTTNVLEDTEVDITLPATDVDGDSLIYDLATPPTNGVVSDPDVNGVATYTPRENYNGPDSFTFTVWDGELYATGRVSITVTAVNDAPEAENLEITLDEDSSTNLVLIATDIDTTNLTYAIVTAPAFGALSGLNPNTGALTYTPTNNFFGDDSFTFRAFDGSLYATGTVFITVIPAPVASNQTIVMLEEATTNLVLTASIADDSPLTFAILTPPAHGSLSPLDPDTGEVAYTPTANYRGADSFSFTAYDGALYATGTVSFTILAATNWHSVAMTPAGDLMAVVDFGGGIYTSTNYGGSWQKTSALDRNWVAVVISFAGENPGDFMAAAAQGDGIYTSTNRGVSWNKTSATNANWTAMVAGYDGRKNLWKLTAAARYDGIYTSTNSGTTWQKTTAPALDWTALAATFPGGTVGATAYGDGIYFSTDSGANWGLSLGSEVEGFNNWSCLALAANFNTVQLLAGGILGGRLYTALDFDAVLGESFTPDQDLAWRGLGSAEPAEAGTFLVAATTGGVYTSADSGDNWAATAAPAADWRAVALAPDGSKYIAAAYGGAIYLYDPPIRLNLLPYSLRTDIVAAGLTFTWANNSAASGYGLQQTSSLNPATWTDVDAFALGGETYDDGNLRVTIIPRPATTAFYRLKR
ncbi:MAG: hypothetical protein RJB55_2753, partial [Verrucomicrobiota bacterium]